MASEEAVKESPKALALVLIAIVCHEANRAFCAEFMNDHSQLSWNDAPDWQRYASESTAEFLLENPDASDSVTHEVWMQNKIADGWVYGDVKDVDKKTHPCLVPFDKLPLLQQKKDVLFRAIVKALADTIDLGKQITSNF